MEFRPLPPVDALQLEPLPADEFLAQGRIARQQLRNGHIAAELPARLPALRRGPQRNPPARADAAPLDTERRGARDPGLQRRQLEGLNAHLQLGGERRRRERAACAQPAAAHGDAGLDLQRRAGPERIARQRRVDRRELHAAAGSSTRSSKSTRAAAISMRPPR